MDTKLIVVRHAQGEGNLLGEFHGQYNSDLTELGHRQASCTADFLRDTKIDICFSSDILRAYSTALHITKGRNIEVVKCEGLREIHGGKWERMRFDDIEKIYPKEHREWKTNTGEFTCPDGESVKHLSERILAQVEEIVKTNAGKTILITSHATPIRTLGCKWQNRNLREIVDIKWVPNASVTIVEYDSKTLAFNLIEYAYCEHLQKEGLVTELPKNI